VRASPLARFLLVAYSLLVVYASLYPLAEWRDPGVSALAFLAAPWPRYMTAFDLAANVFGYAPFGLLCTLAVHPRLRGAGAVLLAATGGALLALGLEAAQSYLPARIASNVDLIANLAGAALGGVAGVLLAPWLLEEGPLRRLRGWAFLPGAETDLGFTLLGLWLFAQLNPATLLFGTGDLRDLLAGAEGVEHGAELFISVEAATTAANLLAVSLLASALLAPGAPARAVCSALAAAALAVKTLGFAILMEAEDVLAWLTPGAQQGLAAGFALMLAAVALPRASRLALAGMLVMVATVLVNLAPPNPYLAAILKVWTQGHFLHFNGLTHLVSAAWPFAALAYLFYLASRRVRER
jgi:VanZ family protein